MKNNKGSSRQDRDWPCSVGRPSGLGSLLVLLLVSLGSLNLEA